MSEEHTPILNRRNVLKSAAAMGAVGVFSGQATASDTKTVWGLVKHDTFHTIKDEDYEKFRATKRTKKKIKLPTKCDSHHDDKKWFRVYYVEFKDEDGDVHSKNDDDEKFKFYARTKLEKDSWYEIEKLKHCKKRGRVYFEVEKDGDGDHGHRRHRHDHDKKKKKHRDDGKKGNKSDGDGKKGNKGDGDGKKSDGDGKKGNKGDDDGKKGNKGDGNKSKGKGNKGKKEE